MIERSIEKITETEKKTEAELENLENRWKLRLKTTDIINIQKLKEYRNTIKRKMEIKKEEEIKIIKKETRKIEKETEKIIKEIEDKSAEKKEKILNIIEKGLK